MSHNPYRLIHRCLNAVKKLNKNYISVATGLFTYYTRMFDKIVVSVAVQLIFHISSFIIVLDNVSYKLLLSR